MGLVPSLYKPRTRIYDGQRTNDNDLERECTPSSALGRFSAKRIVIFRMVMRDLGNKLEPFMEPWVVEWSEWDNETRPWPEPM